MSAKARPELSARARPSRRSPKEIALARLSFAATAIDVLVIAVIMQAVYRAFYRQLEVWWLMGIIAAIPILHLVVSEFLLSGQSIGKFSVRLRVHPREGGYGLPWTVRIRQFARKFGKLGLPSLNPGALASYYDNRDVFLSSGIMGRQPVSTPISSRSGPRPRTPVKRSPAVRSLRVLDGVHRGMVLPLPGSPSPDRATIIKIGRDPKWADLDLTGEALISRRQCVLQFKGAQVFALDGDGKGNASKGGTYLQGRRLSSDKWTSLGAERKIKVDRITISLE